MQLLADDGRELDLVVHLLGPDRLFDRHVGADHRGRQLGEEERLGRHLRVGVLLGVALVVDAGAQHLARPDRRFERHVGQCIARRLGDAGADAVQHRLAAEHDLHDAAGDTGLGQASDVIAIEHAGMMVMASLAMGEGNELHLVLRKEYGLVQGHRVVCEFLEDAWGFAESEGTCDLRIVDLAGGEQGQRLGKTVDRCARAEDRHFLAGEIEAGEA